MKKLLLQIISPLAVLLGYWSFSKTGTDWLLFFVARLAGAFLVSACVLACRDSGGLKRAVLFAIPVLRIRDQRYRGYRARIISSRTILYLGATGLALLSVAISSEARSAIFQRELTVSVALVVTQLLGILDPFLSGGGRRRLGEDVSVTVVSLSGLLLLFWPLDINLVAIFAGLLSFFSVGWLRKANGRISHQEVSACTFGRALGISLVAMGIGLLPFIPWKPQVPSDLSEWGWFVCSLFLSVTGEHLSSFVAFTRGSQVYSLTTRVVLLAFGVGSISVFFESGVSVAEVIWSNRSVPAVVIVALPVWHQMVTCSRE